MVYVYMCLPFGVFFRKIWYSDQRRRSPYYINWVYLEQIIVKCKNGCFSFKNGILMSGKLGKSWYIESQIFKVRKAHPRMILVKVIPPPVFLHLVSTTTYTLHLSQIYSLILHEFQTMHHIIINHSYNWHIH